MKGNTRRIKSGKEANYKWHQRLVVHPTVRKTIHIECALYNSRLLDKSSLILRRSDVPDRSLARSKAFVLSPPLLVP
jgi:hypothetical protein